MIKKFEQFVSEIYDKPINEAFQSNKLRELIKQHGKPKNSWDNEMLYDIKDDDIIDVVSDYKEFCKTTDCLKKFALELNDGTIVVINNKNFDREVKDRHYERHRGNLGKFGGDEIHQKHNEKVYNLEKKRLIEKIKPYTPEIIKAIKNELEGVDTLGLKPNSFDIIREVEYTFGGQKYYIDIEYHYFEIYNDGNYVSLTSFELCQADGEFAFDNIDLNITEKTHKDLFENIWVGFL